MDIRKVKLEEIKEVLTLIDEYERAKSPWPGKEEVASIFGTVFGKPILSLENREPTPDQ